MWGSVCCPLAEQKSWMTDPTTITLELSLMLSKSCGPLKRTTHLTMVHCRKTRVKSTLHLHCSPNISHSPSPPPPPHPPAPSSWPLRMICTERKPLIQRHSQFRVRHVMLQNFYAKVACSHAQGITKPIQEGPTAGLNGPSHEYTVGTKTACRDRSDSTDRSGYT